MYLVVKCELLNDAWECDANRTPMFVVDNLNDIGHLPYRYEIYEIKKDNTLECIKDYDTPTEFGMFFGWIDCNLDYENENVIVVERFEKLSRKDTIPKTILKRLKHYCDCDDEYDDAIKNIKREVKCCGAFSVEFDDRLYIYGEYEDFDYNIGV